jgi:hypothetical protein
VLNLILKYRYYKLNSYFFKTPEVSDDSEFSVAKIMTAWNRVFSIFYCTFCDVRILTDKLKHKSKVNTIINTLANKWETDSSKILKILKIYF